MKESVNRTLFFIFLLLSGTIVTENPIDVHPYSTLLNFFPTLSAILANMRSHCSSLKFTYSFSCLITACARYTCHFDSFEAPNRARRLLIKTCAHALVAILTVHRNPVETQHLHRYAQDIVGDGQHHICNFFLANDLLFTQVFTSKFSPSTGGMPLKYVNGLAPKPSFRIHGTFFRNIRTA